MNGPSDRPPESAHRTRRWLGAALSLAVLVLAASVWLGQRALKYGKIGPEQPIPFSHRFHVTQKKLSCAFCHTGALNTARAGVPPLQTCMLCHERIIITHPEIEKLRRHYFEGRPVEWVRVNQLPDFVYFNHEIHIRSGFDCGKCHGNVAGMDRVIEVQPLVMGFCVQCHREQKFSHDCYICHR